MAEHLLTGEQSNSKVAAIFGDGATARATAAQLREALGLGAAQVMVVSPSDPRPGRKLEPESAGVFRTIIRAHLRLGIAGAVLGGLVFAVLWWLRLPMIVSTAALAAVVLVVFGAFAGLMLGGLVSLRPDHDPYITKVYDALGEGRVAVVVHAFSREQQQRARELLEQASGDVVATL